ncbi:hypothetical protein ACVIQT_009970 [Bradyrhizobium diazoefficiens]
MDHDDDVAAAAIFDGLACALLQIDRKSGLLKHSGAGHAIFQLFDIPLFHLRFPAYCRAPTFPV